MQRRRALTAIVLLGSFASSTQAQDGDMPTISLRGGYTLAQRLARIPDDAVPLLLSLDVTQKEVVAGVNFPVCFTITNPNTTALRLSRAARHRPSLYAAVGDEEPVLLVDSSYTWVGVR